MLTEGHLGGPSFAMCSQGVEVERKMAMASSQVALLFIYVYRVILPLSLVFWGNHIKHRAQGRAKLQRAECSPASRAEGHRPPPTL